MACSVRCPQGGGGRSPGRGQLRLVFRVFENGGVLELARGWSAGGARIGLGVRQLGSFAEDVGRRMEVSTDYCCARAAPCNSIFSVLVALVPGMLPSDNKCMELWCNGHRRAVFPSPTWHVHRQSLLCAIQQTPAAVETGVCYVARFWHASLYFSVSTHFALGEKSYGGVRPHLVNPGSTTPFPLL